MKCDATRSRVRHASSWQRMCVTHVTGHVKGQGSWVMTWSTTWWRLSAAEHACRVDMSCSCPAGRWPRVEVEVSDGSVHSRTVVSRRVFSSRRAPTKSLQWKQALNNETFGRLHAVAVSDSGGRINGVRRLYSWRLEGCFCSVESLSVCPSVCRLFEPPLLSVLSAVMACSHTHTHTRRSCCRPFTS